MVNFNQAIKTVSQNGFAPKEMSQVTSRVADLTPTPKPSTGQTTVLTRNEWIEILKSNIKRFEAVLRANPNDEVTRGYLQNSKNLLFKIISAD